MSAEAFKSLPPPPGYRRTRAAQIAAEANARVADWPSLSHAERTALTDAERPEIVKKCESGGYLIDIGDAFPVWREDIRAARRLLLDIATRRPGHKAGPAGSAGPTTTKEYP